MADTCRPEPPAPSPEMVTASRRHLTTRYASGLREMLWDLEKRPMPDREAIQAVVSAAAAGETVDGFDIGSAMVLTRALRLEVDLMEADVLDVARASGLSAESIAALLDLPDAATVLDRYQMLVAKRELPRPPREPEAAVPPGTGNREAAAQAGRRAGKAADRAAQAGNRREQLRRSGDSREMTRDREAHREHAARADARAGEARVNAKDAAERVALGLLRAADALDRCAARCGEWEQSTGPAGRRDLLRERAGEYAEAARTYRNMAARYRDIGRRIP